MLSFESGLPVAIIKGGSDNNKIIYIKDVETKKYKEESESESESESDSENRSYDDTPKYKKKNKQYYNKKQDSVNDKEFYIQDDGIIEPLPDYNKSQRIFISGSTGCGKTYYIRKWLNMYQKVHEDRKIYLFSDKKQDDTLDDVKHLIRFTIDDNLKNKKPITPDKFKNSIVIFDDIDSIQDKKLSTVVVSLRDAILKIGRSLNITCICTNHLMNNGLNTKNIYNECQIIVFPLRGGNFYALNYALQKYIGLDKKQIKEISKLPSRMCTIFKDYPQFVLCEKCIYLL